MDDVTRAFAFWSKVRVAENGCWEWAGAKFRRGYGVVRVAGKNKKAHRIAYEMMVGPIPGDLCALHHCDNPPCVHPAHLFVGTNADNSDDMVAKGRAHRRPLQSHCKYGHPLTPGNVYVGVNKRTCLTCQRGRNKASYRKGGGWADRRRARKHRRPAA